ncbi:MAG: Type secretion system domain, type pilus assembly protein PilC [Patescibacteria group bacterium]|nr:Type secretion system domain, type pilus assembly protein PilC [Patescibacteria group bacterium]
MNFNYKVIDQAGREVSGTIDAVSSDLAISSLQRRGFIVVSVIADSQKNILQKSFSFFDKVPMKDLVVMSRQLSALFEAQVSALKAFTLLATNSENKMLAYALNAVTQDIQGGISISQAMAKHPNAFSTFYISMVKAGEESGKLTETFRYLADYLEREFELASKTKNALIYPAFVIVTFIVVIVLMMTTVIPKLSSILIETGQELPIYTRVVIAVSNFFVHYGIFLLIALIAIGVYFGYLARTDAGKKRIDGWKLTLPAIGGLYRKLYLARMADNLNTMLSAGIPVLRALEITGDVVDNKVYKQILEDAVTDVRGGQSISGSLEKHEPIPPIMVAMVRVGEETGSLGQILSTLARFYKREVDNAVDTLIGLIEPVLIVGLGVGVGFLLTAVLIPIYNIAGSL